LADIDEFCGKIKAGKDSQLDDDFCIVARVEALISGWGMEEALKRAEAYHAAGADAILIHSKQRNADEILAFHKEWAGRAPLVIVPTTYYDTPTEAFRDAGISVVIWANQTLRASIAAMRETARRIQREQSLIGVESKIATVQDVFELAGNRELAEAEKRYLPTAQTEMRAIVLAATRGADLGALTEDRPKCMVDIRGQPLLRRMVTTFNTAGIRDITVVRGYEKAMVNLPSLRYVDNDAFEATGEAATLACAAERLSGDTVIAYGDILFRHYILDQLLDAEGDIVLAADALWRERDPDPASRVRDLVKCDQPFRTGYLAEATVSLRAIGAGIPAGEICGEWIGLARMSERGSDVIRAELDAMDRDRVLKSASMIDLFERLLANGQDIQVVYVTGHWLDVDNDQDLAEAQRFL
jgi:phosphoenolpyruvate phosphomutase